MSLAKEEMVLACAQILVEECSTNEVLRAAEVAKFKQRLLQRASDHGVSPGFVASLVLSYLFEDLLRYMRQAAGLVAKL